MSYRTNRIIGGVAPSKYIEKLEKGSNSTPPISQENLDAYLESHLIDSTLVRTDDFQAFLDDRQRRLLSLIEQAMGKEAYTGHVSDEGVDVEDSENNSEVSMLLP